MFGNYFTAPAVLYYSSLVVYNVHACMDVDKDTKKADKVVEKVAKVDDLIILVSHKPGRAGRQPTELQSFSFMAGWEKEGGQWFQHASVDYLMIPFH